MSEKQTKFVFVTGGVLSGLGKGITAASIGRLLKARGLSVNLQKCDPYLNVDAGMLNPREHGECFVTKDGAETDLDLGHYERFLDQELTRESSLMSGRVLSGVLEAERTGKYHGDTVQIIPHVTRAIQEHITAAAEGFDVHIVEIGGTVGDYESLSFLEAIRELGMQLSPENCLFVHVVYMPYLGASNEFKSKPAQNSVRELRGLGIAPNILVCRSEQKAPDYLKDKLSLFTGVKPKAIALLPNADSIYEVPLTLEDAGIADVMCEDLSLAVTKPDLSEWRAVVEKAVAKPKQTVKVGVVAKYLDNADTYMSVFEAVRSAAWANDVSVDITWIDAPKLEAASEAEVAATLEQVDGIVVPGGFGSRGVGGKIRAAQYALRHKLPYLGLCYGLHMMVIAAARNAGRDDANTTEVNPETSTPVIDTMQGQKGKENTGGTMRLGDYACHFAADSLAAKLYGTQDIVERHRHRYEAMAEYVPDYESWGIRASGMNPDNGLVEVIEGVDHPFLIASQYHPEFKSRPNRPHPMFKGFVAALKNK
ncbi:CTP synthetase [Candidatus Saccharibacteria bacterium]|nr:MAG: CTP synthetase [Candidatus Saccharibacteria bacterium]PID99624.1 MAG: CTP synthetase [Candidatus Saccharibacteria bacterium]